MHRLLISTLTAALVLAGCGGDETTGGIDGITVTKAATPKVTVAEGFSSSATEIKVIEDGGGDEIAAGDTVKINYLAVNGRTGKQFDSSFAAGRPTTLTLTKTSILPGFITALEGQKVGSRVLAAIAPADGFGSARAELDIEADDTLVFVFDVVAKIPPEATGPSRALPKTLPKLTLDAEGDPEKFTGTDDTAKTQTEASAHVVIEGKGEPIEADQNVTVQYLGQVYPTGKVFDSSWTRDTPASFQLTTGQLIDCWTDLLVGQKVGSRVVLVCPSDVAYGDQGREPDIKGGDTLVFSIDVLDAS